MAISVPVNARVAIHSAGKYCFAKFLDQTTVERIQNPDALCGNRDPLLQRTANGRRKVQFTLWQDITYPILNDLLPLAGMTDSSDTFTANQTVSTTTITVDKIGAVHQYTNCRMDRMIIRGQVGTLPVSCETRWIAEDETEYVSTYPTDGTVDNIFGFPGTTFSVATVAANIDRFAFVIDNKLIPSWNSSLTVTDVGAGPRQVLLATTIPYIVANKGYYWTYRDVTTGYAIALALTNGTDTMTINFPKGVLNPESPSIEGALEEIRLPQTWEAHRQSATAGFNIVLTNT